MKFSLNCLPMVLLLIVSCNLDKRQEKGSMPTHNFVEIIAESGLRLRKDYNSDKDVIELLPNGSMVEVLANGNQSDYKNNKIGVWLKVKTKEGKIGWIFSAFIKQIYPEIDLTPKDSECDARIGNLCYLNRSGTLFYETPNETLNPNPRFYLFNHPILIEKVSDDKEWIYGKPDNTDKKFAWIHKKYLNKNNQLSYFNFKDKKTNIKDIEEVDFVVNRGITNLLNSSTSRTGKLPGLINNGTKFSARGSLVNDEQILFGNLISIEEKSSESYLGFISKDVLTPFSVKSKLLSTSFPKLFSLFGNKFGAEKLSGTGDDGCSWSYHEGFNVNLNNLVISIGSWYQVDHYEIISIQEHTKNKNYSIFILPTQGSGITFSRFKFSNNIGEINFKILSESKISIDGQTFLKDRESGEQLNVTCSSN
ncbi:MAG: SH3 domain-containing protein [Microcystis sp. LE19-196.1B]|nr:SH3 domain-containing protein [Microcystis sp. LE19-196.1B]